MQHDPGARALWVSGVAPLVRGDEGAAATLVAVCPGVPRGFLKG